MHLGIRWLPLLPASEARPSQTLVAELVPEAGWHGVPGLLHGGMAATLLDECMGGLSHAIDKAVTMTATLEVRYRRQVPLDGRPLRVEAWRERPELRRRNRVHGRLLLPDGAVAVEATALMVATGEVVG